MGDAIGTNQAKGSGVLGIAGVGLIGGSIAAAAKSRGIFSQVIGFGRSSDRLEAAKRTGLIDDFSTGIGVTCRDVDLFISCLPVDRIVESVRGAAKHMRPGTVATDGGSVKQAICDAVGTEPSPGVTFIGSHPLAGSERSGFENADAELFTDRICVITPRGGEPDAALSRVTQFWRNLGSEVVTLEPKAHDAILARTSHLPHIAAAAVASGLDGSSSRFAASGFRDTTRVAAGDPGIWVSILLANRDEVTDALAEFIARCEAYRKALGAGDSASLYAMLRHAKDHREAFSSRSK